VLLGAGSEAGPVGWLAQWRANIVAIDLARAPARKKIAQRVLAGNATPLSPRRSRPARTMRCRAPARTC
jgi:hypothetical protein